MQLYQQRDFGEKINATFQYATQHFRSLGMALLYIAGPVALASGIATGLYQQSVFNALDQPVLLPYGSLFSISYILSFLFSLLTNLAVSLTVYGHLRLYSHAPDEPISVGAVWSEILAVFSQALVASALAAVVIIIGTLFLIVPGIYLGVVLSLAIVVTVFEDVPANQLFNRCFELIQGKWWSTFGLILVVALIVWAMSLLFTLPLGVISLLRIMKVVPNIPGAVTVLTTIIGTVGRALLSSLLSLAIAFQYFNLVERREGRGLLTAIDNLGTPPTESQREDYY